MPPYSAEEAFRAARTHVSKNHPGRTIARLLQDSEDYLIELQPLPGGVQLGGAATFISKADGFVWEEPAVLHYSKIMKMRPVEL